MKRLLPFVLLSTSVSTVAEPLSSSTQYVVREIGSTAYIEPAPNTGPNGIAGAIFGTDVAASLQSQPIRLRENSDYACEYQNILSTKIKGCTNLK